VRQPAAASISFPCHCSKRGASLGTSASNTTGKSFKNLHSQRHTVATMRSWCYHLGREGEYPRSINLVPISPVIGEGPEDSVATAMGNRDADPTTMRKHGDGGGSSNFDCDICGKTLSCAQGLRTHKRQVHELRKYGDGQGPLGKSNFCCQECGKVFRKEEALAQHRRATHIATERPFQPQGATGPSTVLPSFGTCAMKNEQAVPMQYLSSDEYDCCAICGMKIPRGSTMEAHLEALRPLVGLQVQCLCGRSFVEERALQQHVIFCSVAQKTCGAMDEQK